MQTKYKISVPPLKRGLGANIKRPRWFELNEAIRISLSDNDPVTAQVAFNELGPFIRKWARASRVVRVDETIDIGKPTEL